jgi:hypothetical protein
MSPKGMVYMVVSSRRFTLRRGNEARQTQQRISGGRSLKPVSVVGILALVDVVETSDMMETLIVRVRLEQTT